MSVVIAGVEFDADHVGVACYLGAAQWRRPGPASGVYGLGLREGDALPPAEGHECCSFAAGVAGSEAIARVLLNPERCLWRGEDVSMTRYTKHGVGVALERLCERSKGVMPYGYRGLPDDELVAEPGVVACWAHRRHGTPRAGVVVFDRYASPTRVTVASPLVAIGPGAAHALSAGRVVLDAGGTIPEAVREGVRAGRHAAGLCRMVDLQLQDDDACDAIVRVGGGDDGAAGCCGHEIIEQEPRWRRTTL